MGKRKRDSSEQKSVTVRSTNNPETPDIPTSCPFHNFSVLEVAELRGSLLGWYDEHQRQLPWRDIAKADGDPNQKAYAVWVSEIMLQQTRVTTVIEYYKRWMKVGSTLKAAW